MSEMSYPPHLKLLKTERGSQMGRAPPPPWSELPQELLTAINKRLTFDPIDILSFRSVCRTWCSASIRPATTLFPPLPLTTPNPPSSLRIRFSGSDLAPSTILTVTAVYALCPPTQQMTSPFMPKAWVLFMDQSISDRVSIREPFSKQAYSLPMNFPRNLNLVDFNASELGRFYNLSYVANPDGKLTRSCRWFGCVYKVVVFGKDDGLGAVVLSDEGKLGLLRLGSEYKFVIYSEENQWEIIHDGKGFRFDDVIHFKNRLLGIDRRGRVLEIEICGSSCTMKSVVAATIAGGGGGGRRKRLVESLGRLYLVVRCNARGTDALFKVFEFYEGIKKWVEVKSIGDQTFFVGVDFSFSAPAEKLHASYGKNCILFGERSFVNYSGDDDDYALYQNLKSPALHVGVWHLENAAQLGVIGSLPGYSNVLWPPPTWIWPDIQSKRVGIILTVLEHLQMIVPDSEKLKAKFEKLPPLQQKGVVPIMNSAFKINETLMQAREINNVLKQINMFALWKSQNLHNQAGTSAHRAEDRLASVESFRINQNAMKQGDSNFDMLSLEMGLHSFILHLEEETTELEVAIVSPKFSTYFGL